jgi:hypothetical protein
MAFVGWGVCRWIRILAVAVVVSASAACGPSGRSRGVPASAASGDAAAAPDPAIRRVDFGSVTFQPDGVAARPVQFRGGTATVGSGHPVSYRVSAGPVYADADGDGDEDATIQIGDDGGGNGANSAWWIWLWDGGRARQAPNPFGEHSRCGGPLALVVAAPDGFAVNDRLWAPDSGCVDGSSTPESYTIGVRSGFAVRVRPALSAARQCDPRTFDEAAAPPVGTVLRAARDERAPVAVVVAGEHRVQRSGVQRRYGDPRDPWVFVLHDDGRRRICAWAPSPALAPPR